MAPLPHSSTAALVEYVIQAFVKGGSAQKGSRPGFAHALKLSYNLIDAKRLTVGVSDSTSGGAMKTLSYRYKLSPDVPAFSVGLMTALMDELSTTACFRAGLPSTPGVSLQMHTELLDNSTEALGQVDELDIVNTVTKLGKTVSYTRTEFFCTRTQQLMAYSSHVKYMPAGNLILDYVFRTSWAFSLYERLVLQRVQLEMYAEKPLQEVIQSSLDFHGIGNATFVVTNEHTNPFGALHGGCYAVLMETAAAPYAVRELKTDRITLQSMQIDFISAGRGSMEIDCETISNVSPNNILHVRVLMKRGDRVCSEGRLKFVRSVNSRL